MNWSISASCKIYAINNLWMIWFIWPDQISYSIAAEEPFLPVTFWQLTSVTHRDASCSSSSLMTIPSLNCPLWRRASTGVRRAMLAPCGNHFDLNAHTHTRTQNRQKSLGVSVSARLRISWAHRTIQSGDTLVPCSISEMQQLGTQPKKRCDMIYVNAYSTLSSGQSGSLVCRMMIRQSRQELVRRWDSGRELFYDDIVHKACTYTHWTDFLIFTINIYTRPNLCT